MKSLESFACALVVLGGVLVLGSFLFTGTISYPMGMFAAILSGLGIALLVVSALIQIAKKETW